MHGWIKLHRQIQENDLYFSERFTRAQAWIDLLMLANHKPATIFLRGVEVKLERGQLAWSITSLAKRWKWNKRTADKFLDRLETLEMCAAQKSNVTTVITIRNYSLYQDSEPQSAPQSAPQKGENVHTDKNVLKNEHNEKTSSSSPAPETTTDDEEVIFKNEFFTVTAAMLKEWKRSYTKIHVFHPELTRISDVLREKITAGVVIRSPLAFLHTHLGEVNRKLTTPGGNRKAAELPADRGASGTSRRVGDVRTLEEILGPLVKAASGHPSGGLEPSEGSSP